MKFKFSINKETLQKVGNKIVSLIYERTASGKDVNGSPFKAYSTKPFKMPAAAVTKRARKILLKNNEISYFRKNGLLWLVAKNGYLPIKKAIYKQTSYDGTVNLILKGQMLRSMSASTVGSDSVRVSFNSGEMTQRAIYNIEKGRNFFGISEKEIQDNNLYQILLEGIQIELK